MNKKTILFIQILGELAIPLMGFFLWNWSLYFILLFYMIENLFATYFQLETFRRFTFLVKKKESSLNYKKLSIFMGFWFLEVLLIHLFLYFSTPAIQFGNEVLDFFMYEDMGIPQGFLLIPLLYFASKMKMKQDIQTLTIKIKSIDEVKNFSPKFNYYWVSIGFWVSLILISFFISLPELVAISLLLALFIYRSLNRT
jgi:hypothetical protein